MERYPIDQAWDEASELKKKVESGEARDLDQAERLFEMESVIDARLEQIMRMNLRKINQGNAGVITRLNFDEVPEEFIEYLKEQGYELKENQVAKILKFYRHGDAKTEFDIQKRAYQAVEKEGNLAAAGVPKPYFAREIAVTPETQEFMKSMGIKPSEKVGVILMDFVPGEDLATKLFKEVMLRHPKLTDLLDRNGGLGEFADMPFDKLPQDRIAHALDYRAAKLTNQRPSPEEIAAAQERVFNENEAKLFSFLKENGFQLHPGVLRQIENTMHILHQNGIVFRDGHQRNFMIEGDLAWNGEKTQPAPRVTVIDFGGSATFEGDYEAQKDDLYHDKATGKGYRDDFTAARLLRPLTLPKPSGAFEGEMAVKMQSKRETLAKHVKFQGLLKEILAKPGDVEPADLYGRLPGQGALKLENFMASSLELLDRGRTASDALRAFVEGPLLQENPAQAREIKAFLEMF